MRPSARASFIAVLVASVLLEACSGGNAADSTDTDAMAATPSSETNTTPDSRSQPLNEALPLLGLEDRWTLREAHSALVAACMQSAGFAGYLYAPTPFPRDRIAASPDGVELRIAPPEQASFGLVEGSRRPPDGPPPNEYFNSLSLEAQERYAVVLYGGGALEAAELDGGTITRPQDGCLTTAENDLYQDDEYFQLDSERSALVANIGPQILSTADFQQLLAAYRGCMASKGFEASAPWDAWDLVANRLAADPESDVASFERDVATADLQCQTEIDYGSSATTIRDEVVREAVAQSPGLDRLLEIELAALRRAQDIL